jgi:hypothetical protein
MTQFSSAVENKRKAYVTKAEAFLKDRCRLAENIANAINSILAIKVAENITSNI